MSSLSDLLRDNFETVYRVHHAERYGFGGNGSVFVAVEHETDDEIIGREFTSRDTVPGAEITIRKDNVAGWVEDTHRYNLIPEDKEAAEERHERLRGGR